MDLATDVLVCILRLLQPNARRRLRLVCRYWRKVIDRRTATNLLSRARTLVVTVESAYVFDNMFTRRCRKEFPAWSFCHYWDTRVVGSRNGIICMCDPSGDILLHNLLTCDSLEIPRLPAGHHLAPRTYGFTHDYATGRYMVVNAGSFGRIAVFTLGEASWRDVSTHGWGYDPEDGFVTIDSTMYWVVRVMDGEVNVISLDLDDKRSPSVIPLPSSKLVGGTWSLTEVHGRLGITFSFVSQRLDKTEVWVMKHGASRNVKHAGWSHWYSVQVRHTPRHEPQWNDHQHLTGPHFAHQSNHILTWEWLSNGEGEGCALYRHKPSNDTRKAKRGRVEITERKQGTKVSHIWTEYDTFQTFDYVETMEPLSVYKCW